MKWRIYYGDGSTFSDRDGSPFDAPGQNVQVIAQEDASSKKGWILMHGQNAPNKHKEYYCWWDYGWNNHDYMAVFDYLTISQPGRVLFGRTIDTELFNQILHRAGVKGLG